MESELKPCAHCWSNNVHLIRTITNNVPCWHVECKGCGIRTMDVEELMDNDHCTCKAPSLYEDVCKTMGDAIEVVIGSWNKRCEHDYATEPFTKPVGKSTKPEPVKEKSAIDYLELMRKEFDKFIKAIHSSLCEKEDGKNG